MKKPSDTRSFAGSLLGALALAALLSPLGAGAQVRPTHRPEVPDFDHRTAAAPAQQLLDLRQQGKARLRQQIPSATVDVDELTGTPKFIRSRDGFLTGPNGRGRGVSEATAQALPANDPLLPIKAFLNEHSALFGYDAAALDSARVKRDYVDAHNGLHTVVWEQQVDGIPVYQGVLAGHITRRGELTSLSSLFVGDALAGAQRGTPGYAQVRNNLPVSAQQAISTAAGNLGFALPAANIQPGPASENDGGYQVYKTPDAAFVRLVWLPLNSASLRLAWEVMVSVPATKERFCLVVDAQTSEVYLRKNLTCYISDATYNIYPSDSPSPFTPSLPTPGAFQPALTTRTLITTPALDTTASPEGWIPDGSNTTTGNNADAFLDRNFDQQPDGNRPQGNPDRVFDFPMDLTLDPTNYTDASTVQLFWRANWYHDRLYQLGFTEAAGNYQQDNFGRGGLGGDRVINYVQSGADVGIANNSMFAPAPDGVSGQCFMFVFDYPTPARDGSLDSEVVIHELTHGTSWRLVGGGMVLGSLQGDGMGEGWSDFYPMCLLSESTDDPNATYANGGYASYRFYGLQENYYFGIRHFPYSTDMKKNPFTFKDIDPAQISPHTGVPRSPLYPFDPAEANEVHHSGEVWCVTLWEVRANLVTKYGWAVGNEMMLQLVTDGMKLTPALPNFLQARDAILLADRVNNGGANIGEIWQGFAKRGMGISATSPNGNTTAGVHEAFDLPGLQVDGIVVSGGNGNGVVDPTECDDLYISLFNTAGYTATGISAQLSTTTPGVIVVQSTAPYPVMPDGSTNVNTIPFRISMAPTFICGTPIDFTMVIKSDQTTSTTTFRLSTGTPNAPTRFDSFARIPIPDNDPNGTNSIIVVSNITSAITRVAVSLHITHTYDQDLTIRLISPDGTTNTLSANHGLNGRNYGTACSPENLRTTFADDATNAISAANPPFVGAYTPDSALAVFSGKFGTNVNGPWILQVVDDQRLDTGTIQCWSLFLSTVTCAEGLGECPGSDLAVGMVGQPEPVVLGDYLSYSISVTNFGPSSAKNVILTHLLPSSAAFISANPSQGNASYSGGAVSWTVNNVAAGGRATMTVLVLPTAAGLASSSATVTSEQPDFKPSNNSVTVYSHVNPPTADLAVGLRADPPAVVLGEAFNFTLAVTNNGPSSASGAQVTNLLPANVLIVSAVSSQGPVATFPGNVVVCSFGSLTNGQRVTASIAVRAIAEGDVAATASAIANQFDPVGTNNVAEARVVIGPAADLAIGISDNPDPVLVRSNLTYQLAVTNLGPSVATGVTVHQTLPPGIQLISTNSSQGGITVSGNALDCAVGTLNLGAVATITVRVASTNTGTLITSATVSGTQADPNSANNTATASTLVSPPFVSLVAAGATLSAEGVPNGAVDNGETVTVVLRLRNVGNITTTNLVATLLATNGVTPSAQGNPQTYGVLPPSGFPVGKPFTFTANGVAGGKVTAVLQLQDGGITYPQVSFEFSLPNTFVFANTAPIVIPSVGAADPYPSRLQVSGVTGTLGKVNATLSGFTHTYPHDVSVLLVSPSGAKSMLLSHAGTQPTANVDLTLDDTAAQLVPDTGALSTGAFQPSAYDPAAALVSPAPEGPYPAAMASFNATDPNGTWSLFVIDDTAGDEGAISNGWSLTLTTISPVNQVSDLALAGIASPPTLVAGSNITYTFTITNNGPNTATVVAFTNALPANATLVSATASQGNLFTSGDLLFGNLGTLGTGVTATVTVVLNPTAAAAGFLTNSAVIAATETDLNPVNNGLTFVTPVNLPSADLAVSQSFTPDPVLVGGNVTFTTTITNRGPGLALEVTATNVLPAGVSLVSATSTVGTIAQIGNAVVAQLGNLGANSDATLTLVLATSAVGTFTDTVTVVTRSVDVNPADNTASSTVNVVNPYPIIVAAGTRLTAEGSVPANGAVDPGETVTVSLGLRNTGSADTANLQATLLPSGGVTPVGNPTQTYGNLVRSGDTAWASFTFTAANINGGVITAALQLRDGATDLGTVEFAFNLAAREVFASQAAILIPDHGAAAPYPSTIAVSGMTGLVSQVKVTLSGLRHSFPRDINALLVSPAGASVLLMSHAGGAHAITNLTVTFDDNAALSLPETNAIVTGTFKPSAYGTTPVFPASAPSQPYASLLAAANAASANGTWSLYIFDDSVGDAGAILGGWSLDITTVQTVNLNADLAVGLVASPQTLLAGDKVTNTISVTNLGPSNASSVYLTNSISGGATYVSSTLSQGSIVSSVGGVVVWKVGDLPVGATAMAKVVMATPTAGALSDVAVVAGDEGDLNVPNNTAEITLSVTAPVPAVLTGTLQNGEFRLTVTAQPDTDYVIEVSTNLPSWTPVSTNTTSAGGTIKYVETNAMSFKQRFYRAVRLLP